jgi:carbon storage regulator
MLVLSRKIGERILLDNRIVVQVVQISGNRVRIGIEAPSDVAVKRQELLDREGSADTCQTVPGEGTGARS